MFTSMRSALIVPAFAIAAARGAVAQQTATTQRLLRPAHADPRLLVAAPTRGLVQDNPPLNREMISVKSGDYRWYGVAGGALVFGIGAALLENGLCNDSDIAGGEHCTLKAIGAAAVGATAGAVIGGLIGSAIPRH
jgi:hypothetical protein